MVKEKTTGSLVIVGCGLHPGHMTLETESQIKSAELVLVVAPNPLSIQHLRQLNPKVENLGRFYCPDLTRLQTYHQMADYIVAQVQSGKDVCCVFYGHPGIFVLATHLAYSQLKKRNLAVKMLPGISADACLFADLNIDPAETGCQSYEATQFLLTERQIDTCAGLILWQIGLVGEHTLKQQQPGKHGLAALTKLLKEYYPADHKVCLYQAPTIPGFAPEICWLALEQLQQQNITTSMTLYIPPATDLVFAKDRLLWLGITEQELTAWETDKVEIHE